MKFQKLLFLFTIGLLTIHNAAFAQQSTGEILQKLDTLYEQALHEWEVPGMAIAIVKNDSVVFAKGYGLRNIEEVGEVDAFTVFPVASITKTFTATALGMLVEQGKLSWDDRVRDYLPWFELYDPYVSDNMTIRDLLSHRSGLETFSGDLLWYGTDYDREEVIRRAKYLEPVYGFRTDFGYSNIMFIAAGEIVEEISGLSYDAFLKEYIFEPLGMDRTVTSVTDMKKMDNVTSPHTEYENEVVPIEFLNWDNIGGAGNINSCVDDMASWLRVQLNQGDFGVVTLFSPRVTGETWKPHTMQNLGYFNRRYMPSAHFRSYGLGWGMQDMYGKKVIMHSGGYDGIISQMAIVPEDDLGVIVLTNKNSWLILPVLYQTLEAFLSGDFNNWSQRVLAVRNMVDKAEDERIRELEEKRIKKTKPTLEREAYTGTYHDGMYGDVIVFIDDKELKLQLVPAGKFLGDLSHYHYDIFEIEFKQFPSLPKGLVTFTLNSGGEVDKLVIDVPNPDFDFTEMEFFKE